MDVVVWLRSLGLGKYEAAFRENEIDETVLPSLTAEDLKDLGVRHSGTAANSSTPLPLCVPIQTLAQPLTPRPAAVDSVPSGHAPNAAKSR